MNKKITQYLTPFFKYSKWLLNQSVYNSGVLIEKNHFQTYQKTNDEEIIYYRLEIIFGYVRFYEERFINDKLKQKLLVKGFCLTKSQAINLIEEIKLLTPNLYWKNPYNNSLVYNWAKMLLNSLKYDNDNEYIQYILNNVIINLRNQILLTKHNLEKLSEILNNLENFNIKNKSNTIFYIKELLKIIETEEYNLEERS